MAMFATLFRRLNTRPELLIMRLRWDTLESPHFARRFQSNNFFPSSFGVINRFCWFVGVVKPKTSPMHHCWWALSRSFLFRALLYVLERPWVIFFCAITRIVPSVLWIQSTRFGRNNKTSSPIPILNWICPSLSSITSGCKRFLEIYCQVIAKFFVFLAKNFFSRFHSWKYHEWPRRTSFCPVQFLSIVKVSFFLLDSPSSVYYSSS